MKAFVLFIVDIAVYIYAFASLCAAIVKYFQKWEAELKAEFDPIQEARALESTGDPRPVDICKACRKCQPRYDPEHDPQHYNIGPGPEEPGIFGGDQALEDTER